MSKELERLLSGNQRFVDNNLKHTFDLNERKDKAINGQHPFALVVCCSDSRLCPEMIFDASIGEIFVIRVAGNVIGESELASIEYGINHLNIPLVVILGHTYCGAIHSAVHHEKGHYVNSILDKISLAIQNEENELEASKINAIYWKNYLKSLFSDIEIESLIYEIDSGLVKKI